MIISGWKSGAKSIDAIRAVKTHTGMSLAESKKLIETALEGKVVNLPDDFVLKEDLEDFGFKVD